MAVTDNQIKEWLVTESLTQVCIRVRLDTQQPLSEVYSRVKIVARVMDARNRILRGERCQT